MPQTPPLPTQAELETTESPVCASGRFAGEGQVYNTKEGSWGQHQAPEQTTGAPKDFGFFGPAMVLKPGCYILEG